jgi:hypothetical protein
MVVIQYLVGGEPLYELNPASVQNGGSYYNDINDINDSYLEDMFEKEEANLLMTNEIIERKINVNVKNAEFIKEKEFIKIQNELDKRKNDLALKRKEMSSFINKEISGYKQQQIYALEQIQKYVYNITNNYDSELTSKIEELN